MSGTTISQSVKRMTSKGPAFWRALDHKAESALPAPLEPTP